MEGTQKAKISLAMWLSDPTPGPISIQNYNSKICMYPSVHCSTIYNSQDMRAMRISINRGVDKENVMGVYSGILLSHKRSEIMPYAATRMGLNRDCHTEWSQPDREGQIYAIAYMCNLKYDTNELIFKTEMDSQKTDLWWGQWLGEGWHGSSGLTDPNYYIKMDQQQGPTV